MKLYQFTERQFRIAMMEAYDHGKNDDWLESIGSVIRRHLSDKEIKFQYRGDNY